MTGMHRRALIVTGAAAPDSELAAVLGRFGFDEVASAASVNEAFSRIADDHFDLMILPVGDLAAQELATLEREIRRARSTFFIGTAVEATSEVILRTMRTGLHEFLTLPLASQELAAAVDRLMRRRHSEGVRGQVVTVFSGKGGLGCTSIAVDLSYGFARNHPDARVALVDLVVGGGDVRVHLNIRPSYDIGNLIEKLDRADAELIFSLLTPCPGGVWALPAAEDPELDDALDATAVTTVIEQLRTHFAFTVIDCEHHMSERTLAAMDAADRIVLVTQLNVPALRGTQRTLGLTRRLGYPDEKVCVVVNRLGSADVLGVSDAREVLQREVFWKLPNDYATAAKALTEGAPVSVVNPEAKLTRAYTQLAAKLGGASPSTNGHTPSRTPAKGVGLRRLFGLPRRS